MKAAVYDHNGPPEVLRYTDVPDPKIRSRDVLIQVEAISVEGGDLINRRSSPPGHPAYASAMPQRARWWRSVTRSRTASPATELPHGAWMDPTPNSAQFRQIRLGCCPQAQA